MINGGVAEDKISSLSLEKLEDLFNGVCTKKSVTVSEKNNFKLILNDIRGLYEDANRSRIKDAADSVIVTVDDTIVNSESILRAIESLSGNFEPFKSECKARFVTIESNYRERFSHPINNVEGLTTKPHPNIHYLAGTPIRSYAERTNSSDVDRPIETDGGSYVSAARRRSRESAPTSAGSRIIDSIIVIERTENERILLSYFHLDEIVESIFIEQVLTKLPASLAGLTSHVVATN